jgi:hypothetical protein
LDPVEVACQYTSDKACHVLPKAACRTTIFLLNYLMIVLDITTTIAALPGIHAAMRSRARLLLRRRSSSAVLAAACMLGLVEQKLRSRPHGASRHLVFRFCSSLVFGDLPIACRCRVIAT